MTLSGSDITTWRDYCGNHDLTAAGGAEPTAYVEASMNNKQCASFLSSDVMTSATLYNLLDANAAYTMYFAVQFERTETSGTATQAYLFHHEHDANNFEYIRVNRHGTGPYTYSVLGYKKANGVVRNTMYIQNLAGRELSSDKFYICICNKTSGGAIAYVNDLTTNDDAANWNDATYNVSGTVYIGSDSSGAIPSAGPLAGMWLYDQQHTTAQIQSMYSWLQSQFGPIGTPMQSMRGCVGVWEAAGGTVTGSGYSELANEAP